jgi:arylsulfatase A-like enzyme
MMNSNRLTRRDFLKVLSIAPLLQVLNSSPAILDQELISSGSSLPNILFLVFDALSASHVSLYGYHRETTPNLERFAEHATVFHRNYAAGNFTTPGTASIFTGTYPWSHRGLHIYGTVDQSYIERNIFRLFKSTHQTVAYSHNPLVVLLLRQFIENLDLLPKMEELGLVGNSLSERYLTKDYNVAYWAEYILHGFKKPLPSSLLLSILDRAIFNSSARKAVTNYGTLFPRGIPNNQNDLIFALEDAIDWIQNQLSVTPHPFLGYFHFWPPHYPYSPREEFIGIFDDGWAPQQKPTHFFSDGSTTEHLNTHWTYYDEHIAYADAEFGRLYDNLIRTGLTENTYIIFATDHGEMLERGIFGHSTQTLYEPIIWAPLLISKPGQRHRQDVYTPTNNIDLLPTLLHATGNPIPDWIEGQVLPTFNKKTPDSERSIFSVQARTNPKHGALKEASVAMVKERYKLIHYFGYEGHESVYELYDLLDDPEELNDLYNTEKSLATRLQMELEERLTEEKRRFSGSEEV